MKRKVYCSFCGKRDDEVEIMVQARIDVSICCECVDLCSLIVIEKRSEMTQAKEAGK